MPERARAVQYVRLVSEMLATRAWIGSYHSFTFPDAFACGLHEDPQKAKDGMLHAQRMWNIIKHAEDVVHGDETNVVGLQKLLDDMAFHRHQISRELVAQAIRCGWDHEDNEFQCM
eukprot:2979395-Pyramimonas_sp.AAC.1